MSLLRRCFRILFAVPFWLAGVAYGAAIDFFDAGVDAAQRDIEARRVIDRGRKAREAAMRGGEQW